MKAPRVTLDQWRTLQAVVDHGGFAQAAEVLHRSQSSVSYTVARMQEQLGVPLLRIDGRKAVLTEAGSVLLRRSRHLVKQASQLEDLAHHMEQGWEAEVRLVVDAAYPSARLVRALARRGAARSPQPSESARMAPDAPLRPRGARPLASLRACESRRRRIACA